MTAFDLWNTAAMADLDRRLKSASDARDRRGAAEPAPSGPTVR